MSLSYDEALTFLKDVLMIPADVMSDLTPGPKAKCTALLLSHIINGFLATEPFQSISLMSTDTTDRKRPEWPEIKKSMFLKQGGICYSLNSFAFVLLKTLGYDASLAHSTVVCGTPCPDNHVVILTRSLLKKGDVFLADVGVGYSMARAVPLEFEKESPVYVDSYHTYKLQKRSRNRIYLLQQPVRSVLQKGTFDWKYLLSINPTGNAFRREASSKSSAADRDLAISESEWKEFYFFDPTEQHVQLDEFFQCFDICYGDVNKLTMHSSPRALCWPAGRFQAILHSKLSLEISPGILTKYEINDIMMGSEESQETPPIEPNLTVPSQSLESNRLNDEGSFQEALRDLKSKDLKGSQMTPLAADVKIIQAYQKLFPQFPAEMVASALKNWRKSVTPKKLPSYLN